MASLHIVGSLHAARAQTANGTPPVVIDAVPAATSHPAPEPASSELASSKPNPAWQAPKEFRTESRGSVKWVYHPRTTSAVRPLQYEWSQQWRRISKILGQDIRDNVEIRVARDAKEMAELAPPNAPPPGYAIGVAYPSRGLMIVALSHNANPQGTQLDKTFVHEMVHLALYRASQSAAGKPGDVPRWFTEGVAIHLADEANLERFKKMAIAAWAGELIPLGDLSSRFPRHEHQVTLAYAQSASFVAHMLKGEQDRAQFHKLIEGLREGLRFEQAVAQSYGVSLQYLEREWRQIQQDRFSGLPILLSGGGIWALGFVVILFGYLRRRRRTKRKLERWAEEEAQRKPKPILAVEGRPATAEQVPAVVVMPGGVLGEIVVPTVEFDGKTHTLH